MQYLKYLTLFLTIPVMVSCGGKQEETALKDTDIIPVKVIPLNRAAAGAAITASGKFTTDDEVYLSFKTGGIINRIMVKEGDAIRPGQLLATLHLTEINAQVGQVQAGYDKAQRDLQRVTNLYHDSVASLEQLQNARTALEQAKQQLAAAQFNRNYSEIRATQSGYVLRRMVNEGQVAGPGTPVLQTNGANTGKWVLRIGVSDKDWARIGLQDQATIKTEALAGTVFTGSVIRRSEGVDPATGLFTIDLQLDKHDGAKLASGMFGSAVITTKATVQADDKGGWAIPYDALLDGEGSSGYVFVTHDGHTAEKVKVTIASMEKNQLWISEGLPQAGMLIISGSAYLTDKSRIKVIP